MLDDFGLAPAVRWYVETHLQASGVRVVTDIDSIRERLPPEVETAVYRIVQEALSNVARHAHATRAILHVNTSPGHVSLSVSDNGIGFDPKEGGPRGSTGTPAWVCCRSARGSRRSTAA